MQSNNFFRRIKELWFAFFILIICISFVIISQDYGRDASLFPFTVGLITSILLSLEIYFIFNGKTIENEVLISHNKFKILSIVWFILNLIIFLYFGVVFAIFISTVFYWYFILNSKFYISILFGIIHPFLFWLAFEYLAGFRLYSGFLDF